MKFTYRIDNETSVESELICSTCLVSYFVLDREIAGISKGIIYYLSIMLAYRFVKLSNTNYAK